MAARDMKYNLRQDENESMRVIIDCDPGNGVPGANIDDGLALALAIAAPQITTEMITTVAGNTPVETGYAVAKELVRQLDIPVSVYRGAARALREDPRRGAKTRSWRRSRWLTPAMVGRPCPANVPGRAASGTTGHRRADLQPSRRDNADCHRTTHQCGDSATALSRHRWYG